MLNDVFGSSFQIISICVCFFNLSNFTCDTDGKASCEIVTYQREGVFLCVHMLNIYRINDRLVSVIESFTYNLLLLYIFVDLAPF